jgi:predicted nucleotidyltransferase
MDGAGKADRAMSTTVPNPIADEVIGTLRRHEAELRQAGIEHLCLFGSVARGEADAASDVDLIASLNPAARIGLFGLAALEQRLASILGRKVDLVPEPIETPRFLARIAQDRKSAF